MPKIKNDCKFSAKSFLPKLGDSVPTQLLVLGRLGTAKTQLMHKLLLEEIQSEQKSVVVVDTTGELTNLILAELGSEKLQSSRFMLIEPTAEKRQAIGFLTFSDENDASRKAEAIVDAFRLVYQNQVELLDLSPSAHWSNHTDKILQLALLLLMYSNCNMHDMEQLLTDNDCRDIFLERFNQRTEVSNTFKNLVIGEWSTLRRMARTDSWLDWTEPILHCTKLLLRSEISYVFDFRSPWLENPAGSNVIAFARSKSKRGKIDGQASEQKVARDKVQLPSYLEEAIAFASASSTDESNFSQENAVGSEAFPVLNLEKIIAEKKILLINFALRDMHADAAHISEAVAAVFLASLIGAARNLWAPRKDDYACNIYCNSVDNVLSTRTIHRLCRDSSKYRVSMRISTNSLPVKTQSGVDKLVDELANVAVFAVPKADAELLGTEVFRCTEPGQDKTWLLMKQKTNEFCFYQARTGELAEMEV